MIENGKNRNRDARAAEDVLGMLTAEDRAVLETEVETDDALAASVGFWQDRFQTLADRNRPVVPSHDVLAGLEAALEGLPQPGSLTIRADEGDWHRLFEGVFKKTLLVDASEGVESYLLRLEPGASCPSHSHTKTEECLLMEGEMTIGEARFRAGDYHAVPPEIPHLPIRSETGALLFIRSELHG